MKNTVKKISKATTHYAFFNISVQKIDRYKKNMAILLTMYNLQVLYRSVVFNMCVAAPKHVVGYYQESRVHSKN